MDWNQGRENVYAGAAWLGGAGGAGGAGGGGAEVIEQLRKPTALVCSSRGGEKPSLSGGRSKRDEQLLDKVKSCVTKGGTVLIPTDSSARLLELAYLLEHAWRADVSSSESKLSSAKLYLTGRHVHSVMRYARSMLEWMDDNIVREFEAVTDGSRRPNGAADGTRQGKETGPFDFRYLRLLDRRGQVDKVLSRDSDGDAPVGKVIIASDTSLEWGFSKLVLKQLAQDPVNMVILTEYPSLASESRPSLARTLWTWWKDRQENATEGETSGDISRDLDITEYGKQALEGNDLVRYQQWLAQQRQLQTTLQGGAVATLETSGDVGDDVSESSSESEDSENEQQGRALNAATTLGQVGRKKAALTDQDLGVNILLKKKGVYDFAIRDKKGRDRMFPHPVRRKRDDEYGEIIRPEDFLRAEEREDGDAVDVDQLGKGDSYDNLGKKRKWDDAAPTNKGLGSHANKRPMVTRSVTDEFQISSPDDGVDDELDAVPDDPDDAVNGPAKLVTTTGRISVKLQIGFVDFTGIHDKRSLHMLIPLIQPRKLILVGGSSEDTMTLASDCKKLMIEGSFDIYTPSMGTTIDASVDTNAWVVKLAPTLVKQLKWQSVRGLSIATVTGRLLATQKHLSRTGDEDAANKRVKTEESQSSEAAEIPGEPTLDVLPASMASATRSVAQPLHVGDLRLADLRKAMQQTGHTAEFRGEGTLVIDGSVMVRKTATGRIDVESIGLPLGGGPASQMGGTFYAVKRTIYENLAVVAGA